MISGSLSSLPDNVQRMLQEDAFSRWLGIAVTECRPGFCAAEMIVRSDMLNGFGVAHGAIVYALADSALAFACNADSNSTVSIENTISYPHKSVVGDVLRAVATERAASKKLAYYDVTVANQENVIVGLFRGTVYRTEKAHR